MNKIIKIALVVVIILAFIGICAFFIFKGKGKEISDSSKNEETAKDSKSDDVKVKKVDGITVVPTMLDKITTDSAWCGTFQLVWNDMKNDVVKKDIVFTPQVEMANNLNKEEFTEDMISEEYYYKKYGLKTLELKSEIEKGIKDKFDQESDILDSFDWSKGALDNDGTRYFFYSMLYRKFEYLREFDKLPEGEFANKYKKIKYFGIDEDTPDIVENQVRVLYYDSEKDFAIKILTKNNDEVIFCKNPKGSNFNSIYENMMDKVEEYIGKKSFAEKDLLKVPYIEFDEKKEYSDIQGKDFSTNNPKIPSARIEKAIHFVKFSIDEKGGEVKSEAGIDMVKNAAPLMDESKPRKFYIDDTFALFIKESSKNTPYFAARIEDITKYQ